MVKKLKFNIVRKSAKFSIIGALIYTFKKAANCENRTRIMKQMLVPRNGKEK